VLSFFKMKENKSYTELNVWKVARSLCSESYSITKSFPKDEVFGLSSQIRRSAVSIASNIAEGCGRRSSKDTLQFLFIARGSIYELETQFFVASDQKYISDSALNNILEKITNCKKLLNGFISHYEKKPPKH
jgi:four helix bundle protein